MSYAAYIGGFLAFVFVTAWNFTKIAPRSDDHAYFFTCSLQINLSSMKHVALRNTRRRYAQNPCIKELNF